MFDPYAIAETQENGTIYVEMDEIDIDPEYTNENYLK